MGHGAAQTHSVPVSCQAQTADQRSAHQQLATLLQDQMQQLQADIANLRSEHGSFQAACLEAQEKQEQKLNTDLARIRQVEAVFESAASSEMWDPEKEGERRNSDSRFVGKLQQLPQQMDQLVHASATTLRVVQRLVCELVEPHEVEEEVRRLRAASESLLGTKEAEQWEGGQEGKRVTIQESQEVQASQLQEFVERHADVVLPESLDLETAAIVLRKIILDEKDYKILKPLAYVLARCCVTRHVRGKAASLTMAAKFQRRDGCFHFTPEIRKTGIDMLTGWMKGPPQWRIRLQPCNS